MTEAQFQAQVVELCKWLRLRVFHPYDSRRSAAGYPDLTIVGPGGVVWAELKTDKGKLSPTQREWLAALEAAGQRAYVWRPSDLQNLTVVLKQIARPILPR